MVQGNCILEKLFKYKPHLTSHYALSTLFTKRRWGIPKCLILSQVNINIAFGVEIVFIENP